MTQVVNGTGPRQPSERAPLHPPQSPVMNAKHGPPCRPVATPSTNCVASVMASLPDDPDPFPERAPLSSSSDDGDGPLFNPRLFRDITYPTRPPPNVLDLCPTPAFTALFSTLYALFRRNELSERALQLTTICVKQNPSNPTVWIYRRKLVDSGITDQTWQKELAFTASILKTSRKNYQIWEYRRHCVIQLHAYKLEFDFIDVALNDDAKNYHAWAHRAWLILQLKKTQQLLLPSTIADQFSATEWFISSDVRNNSAWNFRSFLLSHVPPSHKAITPQSEADFACDMAALAPRNESPWNYLIALFRLHQVDLTRPLAYANYCLSIDAGCIAARRFLVLMGPRQTEEDVQKLEEHCTLLANGIDPIRKKYWLMKRQALQNKRCS